MPFNGVGVFTRLYSWVQDAANGINITASRMDAEDNGFAAGLSNCVTRDGEAPPTANLPMGGFKFTGLGTGMNPGDSVTFAQVFTGPAFMNASIAANPALADNSLLIPSTSWVVEQDFAPLASPTFSGTPTAPAPAAGTANAQICTTGYAAQLVAAAMLAPLGVVPDFLLQAQGIR